LKNGEGERLREQVIREGDDVYLFLDRKRTYLIKAKRGQKLHTHKGFINLDDLIGRRFGESVVSSLGTRFFMFEPTIWDYVRKMAHATQIIYPKDAGLIVLYSSVGPGCRIVEAGTGSGALTSVLAYFASPNGRVYSYEIRSEFLETARKNIERAGVLSNVELKNKDVNVGIEEADIDPRRRPQTLSAQDQGQEGPDQARNVDDWSHWLHNARQKSITESIKG